MIDLTDLPSSEAIVIRKAIQTQGDFLDETELTEDDFTTNEGYYAFMAIKKIRSKGLPIDTLAVTYEEPRVEQWLWKNSDVLTHAAHYHADMLHDAGVRRRLLAVAKRVEAGVKSVDLSTLISQASEGIDEAVGLRKVGVQFLGDVVDRILDEAQREHLAYMTPWSYLTETLGGGFRPGALYVLAARPGLGKSSIALQIADALTLSGLVSFSSLEMPTEELVRRLAAQGAGVSHHLLDRGEPLPVYAEAKVSSWRETAPVQIAFDDRSGVTISDIRAHARQVSRHGKLSGVVVDYLQLVSGASGASRLDIVTETTRQLKIMAREMECPVIALSQLNRNPEGRIDKRPQLADLRDSGSIEQDADVVMMLYREPVEARDDSIPRAIPLDLMILKNRHGPTGNVTLNWEGSQMRAY